MHRHFTSPSTPKCLSYTPGKLSSDIMTEWWKAGQLLKHEGFLVCQEHTAERSAPFPFRSWAICILPPSSIFLRSKISLLSPWSFYHLSLKLLIWFPCHYLNFFQVRPGRIQCDPSPPRALLLWQKYRRFFCKSIFVSFYNTRNVGIYLGQQIWRSKICLQLWKSISRVI